MNKRCPEALTIEPEKISGRFWQKVRTGSPTACWLWQARRTPVGVGEFRLGTRGRIAPAHRVSFALAHGGTIEKGNCVKHICGNTSCVNPRHLRLEKFHPYVPPPRRPCMLKLNATAAHQIRQASKFMSHRRLALAYGCSASTVRDVLENRTWLEKDKQNG